MLKVCKDCGINPRFTATYCKECKNLRNRTYAKKNWHKHFIKQVYNLSAEEYKDLVNKADGRCAICKRKNKLQIDHSHETGVVRGLLCGTCNRGLGYLEKEGFLEAAARYLNASKEPG